MENTDYIKQKQERFKNLGIPLPIEKSNFDQPIVNVKDPKMLQRIQEIKNGSKKTEFKDLLSIGSNQKNFQPIPEVKTKKNKVNEGGESKAPTLENFSPNNQISGDLAIYEKLFSADSSVSIPPSSTNSRVQEEINTDTNGNDFLMNFRQKLQNKAMSQGIPYPQTSGFGIKNESTKTSLDEIENKIYEISSQVSKKIAEETIKEVLDKYLSKKTNLQENTFQKVKDDIIKIGNQYYKITPVKVKTK